MPVKYSEFDRNKHRAGIVSKDSGYTGICIICSSRFDEKPHLIGKERYVKLDLCPTCVGLGRKRKIEPL